MSNYVQASNNNEGRRITPTNDDGYNNNNTQNININIKSRKKSSNKTNLRNLKRNEKFFKKFQQEIESSIHSTSSSVITNYLSSDNNNQPILLKSTSTTVIPPIISINKKEPRIFNLADVSDNDSDLFDKSFKKTSNQMNAIKTKPNNLKRISAIPIKTKNEIIKHQPQFPPVNSILIQNDHHLNQQQQQQQEQHQSLINKSEQMNTIQDPSTVSLEDFGSKTKNDEFIDMDLKPVFSKSLKNKIKNHYKSMNSEGVYNSIDSNNEQINDINNNGNKNVVVVPDLINDKFFKNKSTNHNKPQLKGRHSKSNSFESSSFLMPIENGFSSNKKQQITTKLKHTNYRLK
jgi:hypothetical protein